MTKKFIICGDSHFTDDLRYPKQSFGEILAERNNWEYTNLAREGMSNFGIALQIDHAINLKPDILVFRPTVWGRFDIPIKGRTYDKSLGLANVKFNAQGRSTRLEDLCETPNIICESASSINSQYYEVMTKDQDDAMKEYVVNLYDEGIKRQIDCWCISDACRRLLNSGIPFLIFTEFLYNQGPYHMNDIKWVPEINRVDYSDFSLFSLPINKNTTFHYNPSDALTIADYTEKRIFELILA